MLRQRKAIFALAFITVTMTSGYILCQRYGPNGFSTTDIDDTEERKAIYQHLVETNKNQSHHKRLPDIIGIGVKKCGTGALVRFLNQHPLIKISPSGNPETFFFNAFFKKGLKYYMKRMPSVAEGELIMEKTPGYFYSQMVPQRIKNDVPKAKLILSLCNPIHRAFSDLLHQFSRHPKSMAKNNTYFAKYFDSKYDNFLTQIGSARGDVEDVAGKAKHACKVSRSACFFSKGLYHSYLDPWIQTFDENQLLVVNGDELIADPGRVIERIQEFVGVPKLLKREDFIRSREKGFFCLRRWWDPQPERQPNSVMQVVSQDGQELVCLGSSKGRTRNGTRSMLEETYARLKEFFEPHNKRLYELLGRNFNWR